MQVLLKILGHNGGMANCVDQDQNYHSGADLPGSASFPFVILLETLVITKTRLFKKKFSDKNF